MKRWYLLPVLLFSMPAVAQISVGQNDILTLKGTTQTYITRNSQDFTGLSAVIAATGSGQTWNLTNRTYTFTDTTSTTYLDYPSGAPQAGTFSTSNLVHKQISRTASETVTNWSFYDIDASRMNILGVVTEQTSGTVTTQYSTAVRALQFPTSLNSTWTTNTTLTVQGFLTNLTYEYLVDGEGTVVTPEGSFPCLRIRLKLTTSVFGFGTTSYVYTFADKTRSYAVLAADGSNVPIAISYWSTTAAQVALPAVPNLALPADGATDIAVNPTLSWNAVDGATSYNLQVSTSSNFSSTVVNLSGIAITSSSVSGLTNNTQYYWRVSATNSAGTGDFSTVRSFTTIVALPAVPTLSSPADGAIGVAVNPTLSWLAATNAASYTLQVSTSSSFATTVVNQSGITGISQGVTGLSPSTQYFWRVSATNAAGSSDFSPSRSFTTTPASSVEVIGDFPTEFSLAQNYPNPFNPATQIEFHLAEAGRVTLTVFDLLGREITTLVNDQLRPGSYRISWDAAGLPSGLYLYKLQSHGLVQTKRMTLIK